MIIALETYDEKIIDKIEKNEEVDGAVLGDMYCNYRMFPGGSAEIEDRMRQLKKAGKKVYYQTSCLNRLYGISVTGSSRICWMECFCRMLAFCIDLDS